MRAGAYGSAEDAASRLSHPFDDDKLKEECGVVGIIGDPNAANLAARALHALQHRGQEAVGLVSYGALKNPRLGDPGEPETLAPTFHIEKRSGYVRDHFTQADLLGSLPGDLAVGHVRYSTAGDRGKTAMANVQPFYARLRDTDFVLGHNGNLTNADELRENHEGRGAIYQSTSDTECIIHAMARSGRRDIRDRLRTAISECEGAFALVAATPTTLYGVRDPYGVRPLVIGTRANEKTGETAWVLASETCALDVIGAAFHSEVAPGEIVELTRGAKPPRREMFSGPRPSRFCIFEFVYFSRPDSRHQGISVYNSREEIGRQLAREDKAAGQEFPDDAIVCPVPNSGTPAALGYAEEMGLPFRFGVDRNQYQGRTFIEPDDGARNMGIRLKLNVNRDVVDGKTVILIDDSIVRGNTSRKIVELVYAAKAKDVHFRVASPPTKHACFYGVDTPEKKKLMAARATLDEMARELNVASLRYVSINGLYRAVMGAERDDAEPQMCDACFTGEYPIAPPLDQEDEAA